MPIEEHTSFDRPPVTTRLWRYTDFPKFIELLSSATLWLTNAEVLSQDDPYEGLPGAVRFPHRLWHTIEDVPEPLRRQIVIMCARGTDGTPQAIFRSWFMREEQACIMTAAGRRDFYVNCWHAADHESVAMWKIYGAPGAGVAIVTNGARLESALGANQERLYLGAVRYRDPSVFEIGTPNVFDTMTVKRSSYGYEHEVRLVHWATGAFHDALEHAVWNDATMRYDDLIEDTRPVTHGLSLACDIDVMIERVIVSPFAPLWYAPMIKRVREKLGYGFPVHQSTLLDSPPLLP